MAVYTIITDAMIDRLLLQYDIGKHRALTGITQGVENTNYKLETDQGHFILTIYEKRVDPADLPFFINLKTHLAEQGYPCPTPVRANDGHVLQNIQGKSMAIVSFLNGTFTASPEPPHCHAAGAVLADMHLKSAHFDMQRPNALGKQAWRPLVEQIKDDVAHTDHSDQMPQIENWLTGIEQNWPDRLPQGVIHGDLFPDNVLFDHTTITGVIDFYFACQDMLAYDLAVMINAWCFDQSQRFNPDKAKALITGYTSNRSLQDDERKAMLVLARGAALRFYLTRLYDWIHTPADAQVKPHNPDDYWHRLMFLHSMDDSAEIGVSHA
jgi:homoserine kinase type II